MDREPLGAAIGYHFETQAQDADSQGLVIFTPSVEGIVRALRAVEDQMSEFKWANLILSVGAHMGLSEFTRQVNKTRTSVRF